MIAGSIARLRDPADDPLESKAAKGGLPALDVRESQQTFDGRVVQSGIAADTVLQAREDVRVSDSHGAVTIDSEREETRVEVTTNWIADVQDSGLLIAASTEGDDDLAFPFGLLGARSNRRPERLAVDVSAIKSDWQDQDRLQTVTMVSDGDDLATSIEYGAAAHSDSEASKGIGFECAWQNDIVEGVIWESGYLACFNVDLVERFVQFVLEEVWTNCYVPEHDEEREQSTLEEVGDEQARECIRCGDSEPDVTIVDLLGHDVCLTCNDAWQEDRWSIDEVENDAE